VWKHSEWWASEGFDFLNLGWKLQGMLCAPREPPANIQHST
jgi:hypothetical protein